MGIQSSSAVLKAYFEYLAEGKLLKEELTWYVEDENEDIRFQNDEYLAEGIIKENMSLEVDDDFDMPAEIQVIMKVKSKMVK